jgi:hypothetical protein
VSRPEIPQNFRLTQFFLFRVEIPSGDFYALSKYIIISSPVASTLGERCA